MIQDFRPGVILLNEAIDHRAGIVVLLQRGRLKRHVLIVGILGLRGFHFLPEGPHALLVLRLNIAEVVGLAPFRPGNVRGLVTEKRLIVGLVLRVAIVWLEVIWVMPRRQIARLLLCLCGWLTRFLWCSLLLRLTAILGQLTLRPLGPFLRRPLLRGQFTDPRHVLWAGLLTGRPMPLLAFLKLPVFLPPLFRRVMPSNFGFLGRLALYRLIGRLTHRLGGSFLPRFWAERLPMLRDREGRRLLDGLFVRGICDGREDFGHVTPVAPAVASRRRSPAAWLAAASPAGPVSRPSRARGPVTSRPSPLRAGLARLTPQPRAVARGR